MIKSLKDPSMSHNVVDADYSVEGDEEIDVNQCNRAENSSIVANLVIYNIVPLFGIKVTGLANRFSYTLASVLFYFKT